jgi:ubiquinone biosynthesis protein COQ9
VTADLRKELLRAVLPHVPFDGWSERALKAGASDIAMSIATVRALVPGGGLELIELHSMATDDEMIRCLSEQGGGTMRIRDRITFAVRLRLELAVGEKEAVRRAVTYLALPQNILVGTRLLYRSVDAIWRAVGDTSTDWNFYSKRGLLAGVYTSSVLFWLQDESPDNEETWAFLDRGIADVMKVPQAIAGLSRLFHPFQHTPKPQAPRL